MVEAFIHNQILQIIFFQAIILLIILSNIFVLQRARRHAQPDGFPMVSVLIPARNEEKVIGDCVRSLLAQDYPSFEVLVLDDQSSDGTRSILEGIASSQPNLEILFGSAPPEGWLGKNWACEQLAQAAQGDLLLFTDADTFHKPQALHAIVTAFMGERADLLTGYPRQEMRTWGERLLVPFFSWAPLCFNPLELAYRLRLPSLSTAVGQMILFHRDAYQSIGGHKSVKSSIVDDMMLARQIKAAGLCWRMVKIDDLLSCRMYAGGREAFNGFVKNFFAVFDFRLLTYLFVFIWLAVMFWRPLILLALWILGQAPQARLEELVVCISLSVLLWLVPYMMLGIPYGLALLYPLTILVIELVAFESLRLTLTGRLSWKGRALDPPTWKWL
jgi:chlorobactene glucosyltransferase